MTIKIFWRLFASVLILGYALISMMPLKSTPFREYIEENATARQEEFKLILAEADERVASYRDESVPANEKSPTAYAALKDIISGKGKSGKPIELAQFFPDIRMIREPIQEKRNNILMQELLRRSQGKVKLGLDLQGGISFTLRVNPEAAEADKRALAAAKTPEERAKVEEDIKSRAAEKLSQLNQATAVMEDRVNQFGVSEPVIRPVGNDSIEIQLPGEDTANNPEAINSLKKPAKLEFRLVHRYLVPEAGTPEGTIKSLRENPRIATSPVAAYEVLYDYHIDKKTGEATSSPLYVKKAPEATGAIVKRASVESTDGLTLQVGIRFTSDGGRIFGDITQRIADEDNRTGGDGLFAIVLDGKLMSAPRLNFSGGKKVGLYGGSAAITGNFDRKEAEDLANALNNPLEFPLELQDMTNVGASLAKDAQTQSMTAAAVATGLIVLFMLVFYLSGGAVAVIGIFINILMIFGVMCAISATITLPGIAALVLTLGMAVDANILVFERIREESDHGKSLKTALELGYDRAFVTIFDSQLTSLVTAGILIWMGTGSVKGFGVTLAIGILTTLFTCLVTCRGLQELFINLGIMHRLFGLRLMKKTAHLRFMEHWRVAVGISAVLIAASVAFPFVKGSACLSKDFKGGESVTLRIVQDPAKQAGVGEIKKIAESIGIGDSSAVYQQKVGASEQTLSIECPLTEDTTQGGEFSNIEKIVTKLLEAHPEMFPDGAGTPEDVIVGKQAVGAIVSSQLVKMAIISLLLAVVGIMVYVALRFEVGFGIGAMLSTIHDIVVVTGLYLICGGQFSASMIAAILMVAGYSINDTIVVFDRIREELANNPGMRLSDVINLSINRTLSRTLLTSVTVFLSAISLAVFGAGDVAEYGKVFIFGVIVGTFSSIYIASPIFYWWHKGDRRKVEEGDKVYTYSWDAGTEKKSK